MFDDEMLEAAGLEAQIEKNLKHEGRNAQDIPCCCVWELAQDADFVKARNAIEETIWGRGIITYFSPSSTQN